eukprot:5552288-Pleurochrysis_carterae.AAC.2
MGEWVQRREEGEAKQVSNRASKEDARWARIEEARERTSERSNRARRWPMQKAAKWQIREGGRAEEIDRQATRPQRSWKGRKAEPSDTLTSKAHMEQVPQFKCDILRGGGLCR